RKATITGRAFDDRNGNGALDSGEAGLAGLTVELIDPNTHRVVGSVPSDAAGNYTFRDLAPLQLPGHAVPYRVRAVVAPVGVAPSATSAAVILTSGGTAVASFGVFRPAAIGGRVYEDRSGDGHPAGDPGLGGWTVQLLNASTGQPVLDGV